MQIKFTERFSKLEEGPFWGDWLYQHGKRLMTAIDTSDCSPEFEYHTHDLINRLLDGEALESLAPSLNHNGESDEKIVKEFERLAKGIVSGKYDDTVITWS
jgi:hypothetical protein